MKIGSVVRKISFSLLVLLLTLPAAEVALRLRERMVWKLEKLDSDAGTAIMGVRLNRRLWKMFLGNGFGDLRVLPGNSSVAELLPPNGKWSAVDFLLPEDMREASRFTVTSDEHGFRGMPQKLTKKDFRVLVLGSYQAFGHGVNDDQTYSHKLRLLLNDSKALKKLKLRPVVWNGGMQSASLDRGLKVLKEKLDLLRPNLVVLDYGMTDQVSSGPNPWLQPFAALAIPGSWLFGKLDALSRANSTGPIGESYLFGKLVNRSMQKNLEPNRALFLSRLEEALKLLEKSRIPVLLLDQPVVGVPEELYRKALAHHSNADFLSVKKILAEDAKAKPGEVLGAWLNEFPPEFQAYYQKKTGLGPYLGNMLHLNALGQSLVAGQISQWIENYDLTP